jgi:serine acetyltransferase
MSAVCKDVTKPLTAVAVPARAVTRDITTAIRRLTPRLILSKIS